MKVDLSSYNNSWYQPGPSFKRVLWAFVSALFFQHSLAMGSGFKCFLLRLFGASIGKEVVIKPSVKIKYPWFLEIGDFCWIGEKVWLDNVARIVIGNHCCISQGALLLTGNHDSRKASFDLVIADIILEDGVWIGAKAVVCPGIHCFSHSILTVNSVATRNLEAYSVNQGNPAVYIMKRLL